VDLDIVGYLNEKSLVHKISGKEAILVCPNCGKEKLYINIQTGAYHCFRCEVMEPGNAFAKGHFSKIMEFFGDILPIKSFAERLDIQKPELDFTALADNLHSTIFENKKALRYLTQRGFTEDTIRMFKLGYLYRYNQDWVSIPAYENGVCKLLKYRQIPPEINMDKYIREPGGKTILFNGDCLNDYDEIYLCEGEFDCIALIQNGYDNAVTGTAGAGSLLPEYYDKLITKSKITLILDSDPVGQNAARDTWATRLGLNRCWNVLLPEGYDINQFLIDKSKDDFDKVIKNAKQFKIDGIYSLNEALYELYRKSKGEIVEKYSLPWNNVNKLLGGGLSRTHLTVLGGISGAGKTSMALQVAYHFAIVHNIPSLFYCMEMMPEMLAMKIIQMHYNQPFDSVNLSECLTAAEELKDLQTYFGFSSKVNPANFYNTVRLARDRLGIGLVVFDNIQRLCRTGEEHIMAQASGVFKDIAMDFNVMMLLISQPRKRNSEAAPTYDDLKGSSAIFQDSDETILIHRIREFSDEGNSSFQSKTQVIVDKSRFSAGGRTELEFLGDLSKFIEKENKND